MAQTELSAFTIFNSLNHLQDCKFVGTFMYVFVLYIISERKCLSVYVRLMARTLTAFHRNRGNLQRQHLPIGLWDVHSEDHTDPCVLSSYIRLPLPQLNVRVSQLKDASTVDTAR